MEQLTECQIEIKKLRESTGMNRKEFCECFDIPITVSEADIDDYICITDMAAAKSDISRAADVIKNWLRNRNTLEFLGTWEQIYNSDFKVVEFDHFKAEAGLHTFVLSTSEWIEKNAIGLFVKKGRYGGTYARKDIAFELFLILKEIAEYQMRILNEAQSISNKIEQK